MTCRKEKAVAIQPAWGARLIAENLAKKHGADFCAAERETQVTGGAGVNGIHGESTGLIGGGGKNGSIHMRNQESRDGREKSKVDKW